METIFTLKNLYRAYKECQHGKKNTANALIFEYNREKNLIDLLEELKSRKYEISRYVCFIVTSPTPREIFATDFRDRIVHHLLCHEIQDIFEDNFILHSYANRKGKGTHRAVEQLRKNIQHCKKVYPDGMFYLKLDIENFFRSIDQTILFNMIKETIVTVGANGEGGKTLLWQEEILWLCQKIIFHNPTQKYVYRGAVEKKLLIPPHKSLFNGKSGKGLPIGNLTSQFFANVYLNPLDQYVTKVLGVKK